MEYVKIILAERNGERRDQMLHALSDHTWLRVVSFADSAGSAIEKAYKYGADAVLSGEMADLTMEQFMEGLRRDSPGTELFFILEEFALELIEKARIAGVSQVYNRASFSVTDSANEIVSVIQQKKEYYKNVGSQHGVLPKGAGPEKRTVIKEHHITALRQPVILTYSSKGGVGKTVVAVNLAVAIKKSPLFGGARVVLADFDLASANVGVLCRADAHEILTKNMVRWSEMDLEHLSTEHLNEMLIDGPAGIKIAAAPLNFIEGSKVSSELADKIIGVLKRNFDVIIVDGAPSITDPVEVVMHHATHILGIVNPEGQSVQQITNTLNLLRSPHLISVDDETERIRQEQVLRGRYDRFQLVMNHTREPGKYSIKPSEISASLHKMFLAEVPYDSDAVLGALHGTRNIQAYEFAPNSPFAAGIRELAHAVCGAYPSGWDRSDVGIHVVSNTTPKRKGFFSWSKKGDPR